MKLKKLLKLMDYDMHVAIRTFVNSEEDELFNGKAIDTPYWVVADYPFLDINDDVPEALYLEKQEDNTTLLAIYVKEKK